MSPFLSLRQRELDFSLSNLLPPPTSPLSAAPALALISGFEGAGFNVMADSLGDRQFSPKLPASVWSGTFWPHRRADQEALTPALPACLSRARSQDSGNCSLQGGTKGSLVEGFGHSIYFLILTQAIQETLNLNKRSVPWPAPLSNTVVTSVLLSILSGATCAFCTPSLPPAPRGQPPPSAEIYTFLDTHTGNQSHHRLVPEVQQLRQAWVEHSSSPILPGGWRMGAS